MYTGEAGKAEGVELKVITSYREDILKRPQEHDLPTLADADGYKLPAVSKLLEVMYGFHAELLSVGLAPQTDGNDRQPIRNLYRLYDTEYARCPDFSIVVKSNWFDTVQRHSSLCSGFEFFLHVMQAGRRSEDEVADWIKIRIAHLDTTPISFASRREHVRTLKNPDDSFFNDMAMRFRDFVDLDGLDNMLTFKTDEFNLAVDDACTVLRKIIYRKEHLRVCQVRT